MILDYRMKKIKILYLSAVSHVSGAEKVLLDMAEGARKDNYFPILLTQDEGELTEKFRKIGGRVYSFRLPAWRKTKNIIRRYFTIRQIVHLIKEQGISLIHCNNYRLNPYALKVAKICNVPSVTHIHDFVDRRYIVNFLLDKAENLIVSSDFIKSCFKDFNLNIFTVRIGVKINEFDIKGKNRLRKDFNINKGELLVGMIANFFARKRHKTFIEAASIIKKERNNVKFVIVGGDIAGGGLSREELENFAKERKVFDSIIFTGIRKDIAEILNNIDVFVLPSEKEPFPLVVLEAMAAGVPVIVNKFSGGPCEIIENAKNGLIVDCRKPEQLAQGIIKLLENENLRRRLAQEGYRKVKQYYNMPIFIVNIKRVYQKLLNLTDGRGQNESKRI